MHDKTSVYLFALMPAMFVILWSTGFIGAKYVLPYADPLTFLGVRFLFVIAILLVVAILTSAPWPDSPKLIIHNIISGSFIHGFYLGGVFLSISLGMPAAIAALIVGLQPLATALLSRPLLGERLTRHQWIGVILGLFGVALVLAPRLYGGGETINPVAVGLCFVALAGITFGTIYQKAFLSESDLRTGGVLQYIGGAIIVGAGALLFEPLYIDWNIKVIGAMIWLVFGLSIGAISLLMLLIRHGEVAKVATLFYLVPPLTALIAWPLFGERLDAVQMLGVGIAGFAVWLAGRQTKIKV